VRTHCIDAHHDVLSIAELTTTPRRSLRPGTLSGAAVRLDRLADDDRSRRLAAAALRAAADLADDLPAAFLAAGLRAAEAFWPARRRI